MLNRLFAVGFAGVLISLISLETQALPMKQVNFSWREFTSGEYFLTGSFVYEASDLPVLVVEQSISSFQFTGFRTTAQGTTTLGTFSGTPTNLAYDAINEELRIGGQESGNSQTWGNISTGLFFLTGSSNVVFGVNNQVLAINNVHQSTINIDSVVNLPTSTVDEADTLQMFIIGFLIIAIHTGCRRRQTKLAEA
tara:strand:+ start:600 stop:1184 length:585 start_codon:yes stop_codon:yes gene_type:complete